MSTNYQWGIVAFIWRQFHGKWDICPWCEFKNYWFDVKGHGRAWIYCIHPVPVSSLDCSCSFCNMYSPSMDSFYPTALKGSVVLSLISTMIAYQISKKLYQSLAWGYGVTRLPSLHRRLLDPGIRSLIKPTVMEKLMSFPAQIYIIILWHDGSALLYMHLRAIWWIYE